MLDYFMVFFFCGGSEREAVAIVEEKLRISHSTMLSHFLMSLERG